ncbi:MAG: ribonucleoside triphosphate reductase, partial [Clostridia bacterium]|nr:ribonucleoside triphosphate reductase [Clostridia bacterium]
CRLRLDKRELRKRGGGLFGSNPMTGSIGVYTINLPRIGYLATDKADFFARLRHIAELGKVSLEIKRKIIEHQTDRGLYPYSAHYLRNVKARTGEYWYNHFNTIGLVGMNEACLNFLGKDIGSQEGLSFALEVMHFLRDLMVEFQQETGHSYNLEATPAEGTSYRLARLDKKMYPSIIQSGHDEPQYTNSTQLPVTYTDDIFECMDLQDELQSLYTGGTVQHLYLGERINDVETVKDLIRTIFTKYKMPYISITPTFSICEEHGYISGEHFTCPECGKSTEVWSRVVGYLRPVQNFNAGKKEEYVLRKKFVLDENELEHEQKSAC